MGSYTQEYIELHTLLFDIENSDCNNCEFVADCQYYYGKCPRGVGEDGSQI